MPNATKEALPMNAALLVMLAALPAQSESKIKVEQTDSAVIIETDALKARINKKGYVSGIAAGSFIDKKTGAKDIGFGLHIMDFLMAPGWRDDGYSRDPLIHGREKKKDAAPGEPGFFDLSKHYVEGPQICTQARELKPEVIKGKDFVAVRLRFRFTKPARGFKAGSLWEQTLVFQPKVRYVLSAERITSVNDVDGLFYRIDMPGHIRHKGGDTFTQVYLSYVDKPIPASAFKKDFGPDARYLYQRKEGQVPARMIRAYQVKVKGKPGPWLGGLTLGPAAVSEAWCHQRGYVCFIEEIGRKKVKAGESFGAAYAVGWFDDIAGMEKLCDRYKGKRAIRIEDGKFRLE
jgi:hypothetical protein